MTDDESQEAFIEAVTGVFTLDLARNGVDGSFLNDRTNLHFMMWQASAEYHTKRERENIDTEAIAWAYAKLRAFGVIDNTMDNAMMADRLMAMMQEPKP